VTSILEIRKRIKSGVSANKPMVLVAADGSSLASNDGSVLVTRYQVPN
jgi:hypothetical protein